MTTKSVRELGLGVAGVGYLVLVLFRNIYSPLFALVLVTGAAYELIDSHRARNKP